jgi:hypothetical protein
MKKKLKQYLCYKKQGLKVIKGRFRTLPIHICVVHLLSEGVPSRERAFAGRHVFVLAYIVKSARSISYGPKHLLEIMYSMPTISP